ncbi:putative MFS family arabinose efflux permease [Roseibium hamelinense]|uniref:Putative MFS family arabinose efflux permease n=1 Tax=Roseibium hamelinense TaxID=150831 RepID=A0A562SUY2_9HYPH|nr:MFS transporter [Roseibium hamelinense]MTI42540.1 MFS transporter [Roseibium hamelinense]TWI84854.1 putative MFS family arabinose efflux permease [Roseibium hamelinense]
MTVAPSPLAASPSLPNTLKSVWTLLFGIFLLMVANGLLASLLGVRAESENFSASVIGIIMSGFFAGLLAGSLWTPKGVRVVGHVRVFAAMSAIASGAVLLHSVFVNEALWWTMRFVTGFCYAGVFVVAESWLNDRTPQETRGQVLALYLAVSFAGMGSGQFFLNIASSQGADLFILVSVLVSFAVVPLLLRATPQPVTENARPVSLKRLASASPLGVFGVFIAGLANGTLFGMGAVYARSAGFSVSDTSLFMALLILGAAILQWPIGKLSDRIDRRIMITIVTSAAALVCLFASDLTSIDAPVSAALVALAGGLSLSIHSLSLAYTNDYLETDEMIGASSGLVLILGAGSVGGPILAGFALGFFGAPGFFLSLVVFHACLALFAVWRMTRRVPVPVEDQAPYIPAPLQATEMALVVAEAAAQEQEEAKDQPRDA